MMIFRLSKWINGSMIGAFRAFEVNNVRCSSRRISINIQITTEGLSGTNISINVPELNTGKAVRAESDDFKVNTMISKQTAETLSRGPHITLQALDTADTSDFEGTDLNRLISVIIHNKSSNSNEYRTQKMMGDSFLRTLTYQYLYEKGLRADMLLHSDCILTNGADCAMPKFFDTYVKELHAVRFPNEELSPHGKCDFVEALIECARSESSLSPNLIFILSKLFDNYR